MKNKMEIREDHKFLMTNQQGVLTLNIRRPSPFDSGLTRVGLSTSWGRPWPSASWKSEVSLGVGGPYAPPT